MSMKRGISQTTVVAFNPLPKITRTQLAEKAGVYDAQADERQVFVLDWTFSAGPEAESVTLAPGETRILKSDEGEWMLKDLREEGVVVVNVDPTEFKMSNPAVKSAVLKALHAAKAFYFMNGRERLQKQQAGHGYSNEQMEMYRTNKYAKLVINATKEAEIDREIARLTSKTAEKVA